MVLYKLNRKKYLMYQDAKEFALQLGRLSIHLSTRFVSYEQCHHWGSCYYPGGHLCSSRFFPLASLPLSHFPMSAWLSLDCRPERAPGEVRILCFYHLSCKPTLLCFRKHKVYRAHSKQAAKKPNKSKCLLNHGVWLLSDWSTPRGINRL